MDYCWSRSKDGHDRIAPILIAVVLICILSSKMEPVLLMFALIFCPFPAYMAYVSSRRYMINENGMVLTYPFGIVKYYRWDQIYEVALCKVHYASGCDNHILAIRCTFGKEEGGPMYARTAREPWQSMTYEIRHHKKVVSIYYTPSRYEEFERLCPLKIMDYRYLKER